MKRNSRAPAAQERAARLAERREREETHFSAAAAALAVIDRTVGSLDLAAEMANDKLQAASDELAEAVKALAELGYRVFDVAQVLGVEPSMLRPGLTVTMRRYRLRPRPQPDNGTAPGNGTAPANGAASEVAGDGDDTAPEGVS